MRLSQVRMTWLMCNHRQRSQDNLLLLLLFSKLLKINNECKGNAIMPMLLTFDDYELYLECGMIVLVVVCVSVNV